MPILAVTREMGSQGTFIGQEVARRLGYTLVRHQAEAEAAQVYEAAEGSLVATVGRRAGVWEALGEPARAPSAAPADQEGSGPHLGRDLGDAAVSGPAPSRPSSAPG